ncbi:MAG: AsmA-like C-terminal region-containing protein [Bacteroidota bacterium]
MKTLRRVLFYAALTLAVLLIALVSSVFLFKEKIINQFIRQANTRLNTPVKIGKIDVSLFQQFPQLSIVLNDVYVEDSHKGEYPLLTAQKISFQMNPYQVWQGTYIIKGLKISASETNLKINAQGENNYTILKENTGGSTGSIGFELKNVELIETRVHYFDLQSKQELTFTSKELLASIESEKDVYQIEANGELTTEKILVKGNSLLNGKSFTVKSKLTYDDVAKKISIDPSTLELKKSAFTVTGTYAWKNKNLIDIDTEGQNTDIQTLLSLLPESAAKKFEKYQSDGDVYFRAKLKGEISNRKNPSLSIDFGFKDATLFHPDYKSRIEDASFEGSFATSDITEARQFVLILKNIKGKLNEESFTANFVLQDFVDPEVICDFKGKLDAPSVLGFYPIEDFKDVTGSLMADIAFEGKIAFLKNKATAQRVSTQGAVDLLDINLTYGKDNIPLQHLNGSLQFSNNDLALSNVSGQLGHSDFLLNGFFKNIITFLLFEDQPIGIETDLKSKFLDLDQLFALGFGDAESDQEQQQYTFSISRNIHLNFNCDVKSLQYKKFRGHDLKGDLLVKNEVAVSRHLSIKTMGGDLTLSGIVDAKNNKAIDVVTSLKLNGIHLDSTFYVFDNFNQDFIQDNHLKGQAYADVNLEMTLNQNLKLFQETLIADISAVIKHGELNNFEPMKKMNKYLDDEGLSKLRFSDLKNDIHIEKKTIYIPLMEIRSNVTDLKVTGTHTFDQLIDYRVVTPLRKRKLTDIDALAAVEEDQSGAKLFLKITGSTDDYRVQYDTEAVKKKIASDLRKEVQELKDAFKSKGKKKKKEAELEKDDYFDWDENNN